MSSTSSFNSRQIDRPKDSQSTPPTSQYNSKKQPKENQVEKQWPQATPSFNKVDPLTQRLNQIRKKYQGKATNMERLNVTPLKDVRQQSEISLISHRQLEEKPKRKYDQPYRDNNFEVTAVGSTNMQTRINLTDLKKYQGKSQQYRKAEVETRKFDNIDAHYTKTEYEMPDSNISRYVPIYQKNQDKSQERHITPKKQEKPWRLSHSPSIPTNYTASKHIGSLTARNGKSPMTTSRGDQKIESIAALRARIQQNMSMHTKSVSNLTESTETRSKKYQQITKDNLPSFARNLPQAKKESDGTNTRIRQLDDEIQKIRKRIGQTDTKYVSKYNDDKKRYNLDLEVVRQRNNKDASADLKRQTRQILKDAKEPFKYDHSQDTLRHKDLSKDIPKDIPRNHISRDISKDISKDLSKDLSKDYSKDFSTKQYRNSRDPNYNPTTRYPDTKKRQHDYPKAQALNFKVMPISCQTQESQYEPVTQAGGLIDCFKKQVTLDQDLRNAKIWLENIDCHNKWDKVKQQFHRLGQRMPQQNMEKVLSNSLEQHNPFYTPKMDGESIQSVIRKYQDAQKFWNNNIVRKFTQQHLKAQNFTQQKLDLQRKGHLTVQDFVRFLNIETGTFYRNRDLSLLFKRLTQKDKISFKQLLTQLCR